MALQTAVFARAERQRQDVERDSMESPLECEAKLSPFEGGYKLGVALVSGLLALGCD